MSKSGLKKQNKKFFFKFFFTLIGDKVRQIDLFYFSTYSQILYTPL